MSERAGLSRRLLLGAGVTGAGGVLLVGGVKLSALFRASALVEVGFVASAEELVDARQVTAEWPEGAAARVSLSGAGAPSTFADFAEISVAAIFPGGQRFSAWTLPKWPGAGALAPIKFNAPVGSTGTLPLEVTVRRQGREPSVDRVELGRDLPLRSGTYVFFFARRGAAERPGQLVTPHLTLALSPSSITLPQEG